MVGLSVSSTAALDEAGWENTHTQLFMSLLWTEPEGFRSSGPHLFLLKATSPMTADATAHPRSPSMTIPGQ